jgi:microcompartment protein CcmK/EutM
MIIAKVVGSVWATVKHGSLNNLKLLLVRKMDGITGKLSGTVMMAVDPKSGAGVGDIVLIVDEGNSARQILDDPGGPIRTIVAGIVDEVTSGDQLVKYH